MSDCAAPVSVSSACFLAGAKNLSSASSFYRFSDPRARGFGGTGKILRTGSRNQCSSSEIQARDGNISIAGARHRHSGDRSPDFQARDGNISRAGARNDENRSSDDGSRGIVPFQGAGLEQWKLSDARSSEWVWRRQQRKRLLRRVRRPPSDPGIRDLIQRRREWEKRLRRAQPQAVAPKWTRLTPEQMAEYHAHGGYAAYPMRYKSHVESAIATVRGLATQESYDIRRVMAPWVGRLTFRELCTVLKWQQGWKEAQEFFAWMKLQLSYIPSVIVYSMLLKVYGRDKQIGLAEAAFQEMLDQKLDPDEVAFSTMILNYANAEMFDEMLTMYEAMMSRGIVPSSVTYTTMLIHLNKAERLADAALLWEDLVEESVELSPLAYALMITIYRKLGRFEEALEVFEAMLGAGYYPDSLIYNMVLHMLGKLGRYDEAVDVFTAMQRQELCTSKYSYATMLHICEKADKFELAASIFSDMQMKRCPVDEVVYTSVISIYGKAGLYDEAEKLFQEMNELRLLVDVKTFSVMANVRLKAGKYNEAVQVMEELLAKGLNLDDMAWKTLLHCYVKAGNVERATKTFKTLVESGIADLMAYNDVLSLYAEFDMLEDAKLLFQQLKSSSIQPDQVWFGTMVKLYCNANMVAAAEEVLRQMREKGFTPDHITQGILINAYGEANRIEEAAGLLEASAKEDESEAAAISRIYLCLKFRLFDKATLLLHRVLESFTLDSAAYNQLTINFLKAGQVLPAEMLHSRMQDKGFDVEDSTLGHLIAAYGKAGRYEVLTRLKPELPRNNFVYSSMVGALINCNQLEEAAGLVEKMRQIGLKCDSVLVSILLNAYSKAGLVEDADALIHMARGDGILLDIVAYNTIICRLKKAIDTYSSLTNLGLRPSLQTYDTMISVFAKSGRTRDAEKMFKDLKSAGFQPDEKVYSQMMNCYAKSGMYEHAADLFEAMKLRGLRPHEVSYNNLIDAYARAGQFAKAEQLLVEMAKAGCPPSSVTFLLLISAYAHRGKCNEAENALERMQTAAIRPTVRHYNEVMLAFSRARLPRQAMESYLKMERSGIQPDVVSSRTMIRILLEGSMFEEGLSLYKKTEAKLVSDSLSREMVAKLYQGAGKHFEAKYILRQTSGACFWLS
ncbi:pentatricopeptide repeat-containing protein At5g27270 [Selaginella moellendorffii]|uniref:pentatricopeptide repeat-containing protein At5g27270 n=1 Tax=Selaginella moellendorffii TaxID=88036 RepID=UPI000D1CBE4E|nr:pentatricopeptide repeat-containing protein At5g27270 [Selaginella moellendorffii]|eukprot:XP_024519897.1 pentatricopeptide repeat-containing protein At5g27270 [Selaginella moellendorffii]